MSIKTVCETPEGGTAEIGKDLTVSYKVVSVADEPAMDIAYVWMKMPDGRRLEVFINRESGLVVCDIQEKRGLCGNEFVRRTIPPPLSKSTKRKLAALKASDPE